MGVEYARIHNLLVATAMAGTFHPYSIDKTTKVLTIDTNTSVPPASALANEVSAEFGQAPLHRQSQKDDRIKWLWDLHLQFNKPVTVEAFEQAITGIPLRLARDTEMGLRQVTLRLLSAEYEHPLQQQPTTGLSVVFHFEASLSPI